MLDLMARAIIIGVMGYALWKHFSRSDWDDGI
jgi:hypothetical protein